MIYMQYKISPKVNLWCTITIKPVDELYNEHRNKFWIITSKSVLLMFYAPIILISHLHNVYDGSVITKLHNRMYWLIKWDQTEAATVRWLTSVHTVHQEDVPRATGHWSQWSPDGRRSGVVTTEADDWRERINCNKSPHWQLTSLVQRVEQQSRWLITNN